MIIYKVTNILDGKIYIGKTIKTLEKRRREHLYELRYPRFNSHFHRALIKYGAATNFTWEVIDTAEELKELNEKEKYWIQLLKSNDPDVGYNISRGGDGGSVPGLEKKKRVEGPRKH